MGTPLRQFVGNPRKCRVSFRCSSQTLFYQRSNTRAANFPIELFQHDEENKTISFIRFLKSYRPTVVIVSNSQSTQTYTYCIQSVGRLVGRSVGQVVILQCSYRCTFSIWWKQLIKKTVILVGTCRLTWSTTRWTPTSTWPAPSSWLSSQTTLTSKVLLRIEG